MLRNLNISHIALIDELDIPFNAGFSVLTGETGAGKSILIEAVGFVLGERASRSSIQTGAQKASVEAMFSVDEGSAAADYLRSQQLWDDGDVTLFRELTLSGKNSCRINGTLVSASVLKAVGDLLCDLHGQHEHQSLLDNRTHLGLLDEYSKSNSDGLVDRLKQAKESAVKAVEARKALEHSLKERAIRLETIDFRLNELDAANLLDGEEDELLAQKRLMQNAKAVMDGLNTAYDALFGDEGALQKLNSSKRALSPIADYDKVYSSAMERIEESYYNLEDTAFELRDAISSLSFDGETQELIEGRLSYLHDLKRKYGRTIDELIAYRESIRQEKETLLSGEENLELLRQREDRARSEFSNLANELHERRVQAAGRLCTAIVDELAQMGMGGAAFDTVFTPISAAELSDDGIDSVEFMLSANRGEPLKSLVKVASGGEISRIMLAFKVVLADSCSIDTLIFDEIDTGISGLIANTVAAKMKQLSLRHQVLCVTHLPQIAASADYHFGIYKQTVDNRTHSVTTLLSKQDRIKELARIMGSSDDDKLAMEHAASMLNGNRD